MSERVYKKIEIAASSAESFERAIEVGIEKASRTLQHLSWFEVVEQRGRIQNNTVAEYQVVLKVGFGVE
ncbi:MAG: dodecin domain-containing protein [Acidobacteria bacterium]|nr:dodecin domain-containing protein [Acidobacteriota bacterium]